MGTCIICGTTTDDLVCEFHEEDVAFEFEGTGPSELVPNRYYRGTVDGYADFGVFIDIGDHVTGLLHRSELDRRLESLDWEPGDTVYVQVLDVRENGNVDLGWSIRQRERDFRGKLVQTPEGTYRPEAVESDGEPDTPEETATAPTDLEDSRAPADTAETAESSEPPSPGSAASSDVTDSQEAASRTSSSTGATAKVEDTTEPDSPLNRTTVDALDDQVGSLVRLEGEIIGVRQTSGPTVFELRDETASVECAAFEEAGVRAYPDIDVDDVVALEGEVERRHGDLQVETETLEILDGDERDAVATRLEEALEQEARPVSVELLADHDAIDAVRDELVDAATAIRRAVVEGRPVVVRHNSTADGYVAGAAIERAVLPLVRERHVRDDAEYHYFERRPLDGRVYDMDDATGDVTSMLEARNRHDEYLPLVVLVDAGSTEESIDGYELLDLYGAERLVIDDSRGDPEILDAVSTAVVPSLADVDASSVTTTALAANVAAHVNDDVRGDLLHLPALSYWEDVPDAYLELSTEAGYDEKTITERREAVALEAYYQSYADKRELVIDLLFDDDGDLASHVSEQYRAKLETELETAMENLEYLEVDEGSVAVLDTAAFTHRFDFPTTDLLLDELHRRCREDVVATVGLDEDELRVRPADTVDVRELGESIAEAVPDGGVRVVGGRDGHVRFLKGERETVLEAALETLGEN